MRVRLRHSAAACTPLAIAIVLSSALAARAAADLDQLAQRASCLIEPNSIVKLSSAVQGTIAKVEVARGDRVKAGQVVARLESEVEEVMLKAAELRAQSTAVMRARQAERQFALRKLERVRDLATRSVASTQQLEEAQSQAEVANAAVEQAEYEHSAAEIEARRLRATLERRIARSPVEGVVTRVELKAGEYADPQAPIAVIAEVHQLLVQVYLGALAFPLIEAGQPAEVQPSEVIGGSFRAEVMTKDPIIDPASGLFQVTLRLPNPKGEIPAGIRCKVRFVR
jgi:RND family efflux transporter MFP subunit